MTATRYKSKNENWCKNEKDKSVNSCKNMMIKIVDSALIVSELEGKMQKIQIPFSTFGIVGCPSCAGNLDLFNAMGVTKVRFCGGGGVLDKNIEVLIMEHSFTVEMMCRKKNGATEDGEVGKIYDMTW